MNDKKCLQLILSLSILIGLFSACSRSVSVTSRIALPPEEEVDSILVCKHFWLGGPECVVVSDRDSIGEILRLLNGNSRIGHACGYHLAFLVHSQSTNTRHLLPHNLECEEYARNTRRINALVQDYYQRILSNPTHYLYNVHIRAYLAPEEVVSLLKSENRPVYFFEGREERSPRITIQSRGMRPMPEERSMESVVEKELDDEVKAKLTSAHAVLSRHFTVVKRDQPRMVSGSYGMGRIEKEYEETIYFEYGTDLNKASELISDVTIVKMYSPVDYAIQIAFPGMLTDDGQMELMRKHEFITGIFVWPSGEMTESGLPLPAIANSPQPATP